MPGSDLRQFVSFGPKDSPSNSRVCSLLHTLRHCGNAGCVLRSSPETLSTRSLPCATCCSCSPLLPLYPLVLSPRDLLGSPRRATLRCACGRMLHRDQKQIQPPRSTPQTLKT